MAEEITPEDKAAVEKNAKRMKELTTVSTEEAQKRLDDDDIDIDEMVEEFGWSSREDFIESERKRMEEHIKSRYQTPSQAKQFRAYMKRSMKSKKMDPS